MRKVYSHSRRSTLTKCARQYFYECYAAGYVPPTRDAQLGLFDDPEPVHDSIGDSIVGQVKKLKSLSNAYQAAGLILHSLIGSEWDHPNWSAGWFNEQATKRFDEVVGRSRRRDDSATMLLEHYYELPDGEATIAEARSRLENAMTNYMCDRQIRTFVESLRDGAEVFSEQSIGGLPKIRDFTIMGRIDLACRVGTDVRVVDWKMGKSVGDEDSLQLTLYGWWATKRFAVEPQNVAIQRVFLGDAAIEREVRMNSHVLDRSYARLLQDSELMEDLHEYGTKGIIGAFPRCDKEKVCHQCKYQGMCLTVSCATV